MNPGTIVPIKATYTRENLRAREEQIRECKAKGLSRTEAVEVFSQYSYGLVCKIYGLR